ncbi:MAG: CDP-glucose 4,6-dehydratase [Lachnospiraceae bacterium]|nr:CDP-glucose 4,6-dehydratase [Lachnospiraceae bacterium]
MERLKEVFDFYKDKKVFVTGHTGFKGTWLCKILTMAGAQVTGYALDPVTTPALFHLTGMGGKMNSVIGDVRDYNHLLKAMDEVQPEIVLHLAAQPLVRESYEKPRETYETNVMGTVNLLEAARHVKSVKSVLNVTTDKVYKNKEWEWGYRENEELNGYDPYSNSKSCSELVTSTYKQCFFEESGLPISTARAGNVIGGGDFSKDRIVVDCVNAALKKEAIIIRNPYSTRPFQHVLEPLFAYLLIAMEQENNGALAGNYNVGPKDEDCITTGQLADLFVKAWGENLTWVNKHMGGPHEANFLKLDCSKIEKTFHWQPTWNIEKAITEVVKWSKCYQAKGDIDQCMAEQIQEFLNTKETK